MSGLGDILGGLVDSGTSSGSGDLGDILGGLAGSAGSDSVGPAGGMGGLLGSHPEDTSHPTPSSTPRSTHS